MEFNEENEQGSKIERLIDGEQADSNGSGLWVWRPKGGRSHELGQQCAHLNVILHVN